MADFVVREARTEDALGIIAHVKRVADEPNNGIGISSADEFTYTEEEEKEMIRNMAQLDNAMMLVAEADGEVIGVAHCRGGLRGYAHTIDMGVSVKREWRGQGVGTALLQTIINWCRANPAVHKLELSVFPDNVGAIQLYERMGFQREGIRRQAYLKGGQFLDLVMMGIIFEE